MSLNYTDIEKYVDASCVRYSEPMSKHTTLKVGGVCDVMVLPKTEDGVIATLRFAKENNIPVTIIGNGSKLLVKDKGIRGIVIKLSSNFASVAVDGEYITVTAGYTLPRLALLAKNSSLSGLEFAAGIPGNLGGGIYMNAGAYGAEMSSIVEEVKYIDENLNIRTISNAECEFGYRTSLFKKSKKPCVILSAKIKLTKGNSEEIDALMKQNNDARKTKQPLEYPNAGSTFKRPEGYFVGKLIDDLGLKGYSMGGAQISTKHSGFIVNTGNATAKDVIDLIKYIKEKVLEKYNVRLEEEIIVLGEGE